jgi:hypothetical protein
VVARRRRSALTLVLRAGLLRAVGVLRRTVELEERELRDAHAGCSRIGSVATLESSSVTSPSKPASMNPAVECTTRPSRASELFPSSRATMSSGSVMRSSVEPRTNSPGWRTNGSPSPSRPRRSGPAAPDAGRWRDGGGSRTRGRWPEPHVEARRLDRVLVERVDPDAPAASAARIERSDRITSAPGAAA